MRQRCDYWALLFRRECKRNCVSSNASMNLSSHNSLNILTISIGREGFGVFGGVKTAHLHIAFIAVRDRFIDVFGNNRVIGLGHDVEWPPRSTGLDAM